MSSGMRNDFERSLAKSEEKLTAGEALNRLAMRRAEKALGLIQRVQDWERSLGLTRDSPWYKALRSAESALASFLRDATRVLDVPPRSRR